MGREWAEQLCNGATQALLTNMTIKYNDGFYWVGGRPKVIIP